jgi:lipopolysaccharide transport system ATP-binding protein
MTTAILIENVSKTYRLGAIGRGTLAGDLTRWWARLRGLPDPFLKVGEQDHGDRNGEYIWALRDVSFTVKQGEAVGIIGRNGAGKSTLLKILSRVTAPTNGLVKARGRVASLLEVGTGFHPELTGRENIYLNGAIMGMGRSEVSQKFDEIVDFSGVGTFIDTPVKRYSSGMYVRLAFAVAAHLEPEILVVDEVLAVGDAEFQKKCLSKMQGVASEGRTVLFVSHNLGAVSRLTERCILLNAGNLMKIGETSDVIEAYSASTVAQFNEYTQQSDPNKAMNLRKVAVLDSEGKVSSEILYHESYKILIEYEVNHPTVGGSVGVGIFTVDGTCVFVTADFDAHPDLLKIRTPGFYATWVEIPGKWLSTGSYTLTTYVASKHEVYDKVDALSFSILETNTPGSYHGTNYRRGVLQPVLDWKTALVNKVN